LIFVRRDPALFPGELLQKAKEAQAELEKKATHAERVAYIKGNAAIWREFSKYLHKMSYGKCWYSESEAPQAFSHVDHFRPKARARRDPKLIDDGYPWLAFSPDNFRFSAQRSNQPSTDEDTGEVVGKGDWFPLENGSPKASWTNRSTDLEKPVLLDPTVRSDVDLIDVDSEGRMRPSQICFGGDLLRANTSIELYGLNLPRLTAARKRVMRDIADIFEIFQSCLAAAGKTDQLASDLKIKKQLAALRNATNANRPFAKAARAALVLNGGAAFCAGPEDIPDGPG
jgi:hypothetical protein